ncbi:DUF6542 domain-containing protein, partial [Streptomyces sp. WAC05950]|uniref:DUF6542 domain-containing protein n=1 Tax=Streptomyces sp. WAC05950 TaxID=2487419 RepID=UPI00292A41CB
GLFACTSMVLVAGLCWLLFGSSLFVYGLLFPPVAAATALWVRPADLITAPIGVPIAFAAGVWPISGGSGGFGGQLMGLVRGLFACTSMVLVAGLCWLLFGSSLFVYGLLFPPVAAATALWVR